MLWLSVNPQNTLDHVTTKYLGLHSGGTGHKIWYDSNPEYADKYGGLRFHMKDPEDLFLVVQTFILMKHTATV